MSESEVLTRVESGVGRITLNRPKALHALNRAMFDKAMHETQLLIVYYNLKNSTNQ